MKASRARLFAVIITAILLAAVSVVTGLALIGRVFGDNILLSNILNISTIGMVAIFVTCVYLYISNLSMIRTLQDDNEYNLGVRSAFYNMYAFQKRVELLSRINRITKKSEHIIAFTFSSLVVSQNVNRNHEIYLINNHIANFLNELPKKINARRRDFVYAFSRGSFLIYCAKQNEQSIQNICETIAKDAYEFGEQNCRHIWVQPFFGVTRVYDSELLTHQIENALLARDNSEKNFETITYYQDSFRKSVSSNDIEELTQALENKEFVVYYQPKFDLTKRQFISSEALIRWNSKKYGLLAPTKFLNKAESIGLIHDIDIYVLRQVCVT